MVALNHKNQDSFNLFLNNYFNIILAVALIIFLAVFYFLFLTTKYETTLAVIKDSINQKQILYNIQAKKLADLNAVLNLYKKINPNDLKKFNSVLADDYVKESLFGEIEDIVSQNGFAVEQIGIKRMGEAESLGDVNIKKTASLTSPSQNLGEIDIDLSITTLDYAGFKNLIKIFESNLRLFDISHVNFSAADNTANLTLRTYYYKKN